MCSFNTNLTFGRHGELVVSAWLRKQGWGIIRTADISVGSGGPRFERAGIGFILPDLQVAGSGMTKWVEVKTKSEDVFYARAREWRQGIERYNLDNYLDVQDKTGIPGYLAFLVLNKEDEGTPVLRMAALDHLNAHGIEHNGSTALFNGKMVWWPIDIFDSWDIDGDVLVACPAPKPQSPKTSHPWDGHRPARPVARQGYIDFGAGR